VDLWPFYHTWHLWDPWDHGYKIKVFWGRMELDVAVRLHTTNKKVVTDEVNCQDVSQSVQRGDKSCTTHQTLWSGLERMSFVQGPVEVSCSGWEKGVRRTS